MVAIRDLKCSMDVAEMAALGKFEQEFIVYGCCCQEAGKYYYKVSTQSAAMYHFHESCLAQQIYTTPIMEWLYRIAVPSGMQEGYLLQTKLKLAKKLQQAYRHDIFAQFTQLANVANSDVAADLLYALQQKMIGHFDRDITQLIQGIITYAYQQKKLTHETYDDLRQWVDHLYEQMEDDVIVTKDFRRTFFGFGYQDNGNRRYYANASEDEAQKRRAMLMMKGHLCTPMVQKKYYYDEQPDLSLVRKEFLQQLEQWMDEEYWQYLLSIDQLPTVIPIDDYQKLIASAEKENLPQMKQHLQYYQRLWCIKE